MDRAIQSLCTSCARVSRVQPRILDIDLRRAAATTCQESVWAADRRRLTARAGDGVLSTCIPTDLRADSATCRSLRARLDGPHASRARAFRVIGMAEEGHARRSRASENFGRQQRVRKFSGARIYAAGECSAALPASRPRRSDCARYWDVIRLGSPRTCQMRKLFRDGETSALQYRAHRLDRPETSESAQKTEG